MFYILIAEIISNRKQYTRLRILEQKEQELNLQP